MGRYYNGDINGKFMFAVQSSTAADRFGAIGHSNYISYYFDKDHLETINKELNSLESSFKKVKEFFKDRNDSYSTEDQEKAGITSQEISEYADYVLGLKIKECIIEQGDCSFEAEL